MEESGTCSAYDRLRTDYLLTPSWCREPPDPLLGSSTCRKAGASVRPVSAGTRCRVGLLARPAGPASWVSTSDASPTLSRGESATRRWIDGTQGDQQSSSVCGGKDACFQDGDAGGQARGGVRSRPSEESQDDARARGVGSGSNTSIEERAGGGEASSGFGPRTAREEALSAPAIQRRDVRGRLHRLCDAGQQRR